MSVSKALKDMFTGVDNETLDLGRILWAKLILFYAIITSWHLYQNGHGSFDFMSWSTGAAGLLAGGGAGLRLKAPTEPEANPRPPKEE